MNRCSWCDPRLGDDADPAGFCSVHRAEWYGVTAAELAAIEAGDDPEWTI